MKEGNEIFTVLVEDRHTDPSVEAYSDKSKAVARARELAVDYCHFIEDYDETEYKSATVSEIILRIEYSCESDSVSVYKTEIKG